MIEQKAGTHREVLTFHGILFGYARSMWLTVTHFKSISTAQRLELRPLTLLAGANSSGKSSIMQPLLLLKQTLEAPFDPGTLLLNGPNVKLTSAAQILPRTSKSPAFLLGIDDALFQFTVNEAQRFDVAFGQGGERPILLEEGMASDKLWDLLRHPGRSRPEMLTAHLTSHRDRCFILPDSNTQAGAAVPVEIVEMLHWFHAAADRIAQVAQGLIHLPGLRGNPARSYPVTAVGDHFPGTFESYTASVLLSWQARKDLASLSRIEEALHLLGLTGTVKARALSGAEVEIQIGRLLHLKDDLVSLADVGFGVSQVLPALVALQAARPGCIVYLEQPEIHLHPRAQLALAEILVKAAQRGVIVVAETHSDLLLLGVQTLVAQGKMAPDRVKLHWFARTETGDSQVSSAEMDDTGSFGDWPEDFGDVSMHAQTTYLDVTAARRQS